MPRADAALASSSSKLWTTSTSAWMPSRGVPTLSPSPSIDHRMASRLDNLRALAAAHPLRHHHPLGVHVLEAVLVHLGDRPLDGAIERRRAAQPVADRVGQHRQAVPGERAADGFADQPGRRARDRHRATPACRDGGCGVCAPSVAAASDRNGRRERSRRDVACRNLRSRSEYLMGAGFYGRGWSAHCTSLAAPRSAARRAGVSEFRQAGDGRYDGESDEGASRSFRNPDAGGDAVARAPASASR